MATETKNTRSFYNTEIPNDWEIVDLGAIAKIKHGRDQKQIEVENGIYPILATGGEIGRTNTPLYSKPSVLIGRKGTIDKPKFMDTPFWTVDTLFYTEISEEVIPLWLYFKFETINWYLYNEASGVPSLSGSTISKIKIPLPPLPEQKAIAQVLSTADAAIHTTEKLITQKELRKKWLMQQLLTGKKRLKGFSGEWKEVRLDQITEKFSRRNKDLVDARVYSVTNTNGFVLQSEHFDREVAGDDLSNYKIIRKGEFAYNPARVNVGSLAYFTENIGVISSLYVCFRTTEEVLDYILLQILKLDHTVHKINSYGEGGVRVYLWYELFGKIRIALPPIEEQTAIAQVLQAADKEISLLKAKAEKLREQKKGLMQVLLTGKKRLNQDLQD